MPVQLPILSAALLLLLVSVLFGYLHLTYYYFYFGIRLVDISFAPQHIVYRGLGLIVENKALLAITALILLAPFGRMLLKKSTTTVGAMLGPLILFTYVSILVLIGWQLAIRAGEARAVRNMYPSTSSLRQLIEFRTPSEPKTAWVKTLLDGATPTLILRLSDDELIVFQSPELEASKPSVPLTHIRLGQDDYVEHQVPLARVLPRR